MNKLKTDTQLPQTIVSGCSSRKVILHLCADLGSDSLFYQLSDGDGVRSSNTQLSTKSEAQPISYAVGG